MFEMTYAEAVRRPAPNNPYKLKEFNIGQTNELFRRMKGYDGQPMTVVRQFSCKDCEKMWWTRVRVFKQVSKCKRCFVKYDPIPTDLEFGLAFFDCKKCLNKFVGRAQMGRKSTCYSCNTECYPVYIINKQNDPHLNKNVRLHSCAMCDGKGRCAIFSRLLAYSEVHISTGSTLASLNIQTDLDERFIDDFDDDDDLPGIRELDEDDNDEENEQNSF